MATFKEFSPADIKSSKSFLNQLVDVIQEDVSSSVSRKKMQSWITGGIGPGVTSSLFQTVYDQDFSFQTANPIFDLTVGLFQDSTTVTDIVTSTDSAGKMLFPSTSLMMREKIQLYRQFAQLLSGSADAAFTIETSTGTSVINEAMFISFKRLFARDQIKRETFAMKFYQTASLDDNTTGYPSHRNLTTTTTSGSAIYTDVGAASDKRRTLAGFEYGNIVNSANTNNHVGLMFYTPGIAVFDLSKIISGTQHVSGVIRAMNANSCNGEDAGKTLIGANDIGTNTGQIGKAGNPNARFIPDLMTSASIDEIVDHLASCRFSSGSETAMTFQNVTQINSTLIYCRLGSDEFNYSSNPTFIEDSGANKNRIVVIDEGNENTQQTFTFITTVGIYDANDTLLAVAKLSRPIEKNAERDLSLRIRLDF